MVGRPSSFAATMPASSRRPTPPRWGASSAAPERIVDSRLGEPLLSQDAPGADAAGSKPGPGMVTGPRQRAVDTTLARPAHKHGPSPPAQRRRDRGPTSFTRSAL